MFTLLIVDDEELSRKGLIASLNWKDLNIEVIGECSNGVEARTFIMEKVPDIVICDVMMPQLDGLSMVADIKDLFPHIQYIFLSGYPDAKYLKKAITVSAVDYIFKPFEKEEMNRALERAKQQSLSHRSESNILPHDIAIELIHPLNNPAADDLYSNLTLKFNQPIVSIIIQYSSNLNDPGRQIQDQTFEFRELTNQVKMQLVEFLDTLFSGAYVLSIIDKSYLIHANIDLEKLPQSILQYSLQSLLSIYGTNRNRLCIGVSQVYYHQSNMLQAYREAREATKLAFFGGFGKVFIYSDEIRSNFELDCETKEKFFQALDSNDISTAITSLEIYMMKMRSSRLRDSYIIRQELFDIACMLNERLSSLGDSAEHLGIQIYSANDLAEILAYLTSLVGRYSENVREMDSTGRTILAIEKFIRRNYEKNISINDIAEKVYLTPNYLSFLYKSKTGRTINQYIQELRMEHARRSLCESNTKIGDIAKELGFANQNYFTRLFTKTFGDSPSNYRDKHGRSNFNVEQKV